jgi:RHS repeat-associated protein
LIVAIDLEKLYIRYGTMKPQHPYDQTSQTLVSLKFYADTSAYGMSNLQPVQVYYASMSYDFFFQERGKRHYELTNHLGNVLTVISDKRMLVCNADTVTYSYASIISATDYSPFGAPLAGRTFSSESYRFRFNGKENDSEGMGGGGSTYDYGFRIYNAQLGKFLSVDPLAASYPWYTPYQFAGNKPIWAIDLDGLEEWYSTVNLNDPKSALKPTSYGPLSYEYANIMGLSPNPSVILPELAVKPPTQLEESIEYIINHEFIFEFEGNASFGPQIGLESQLNGRSVGFDANVGSVELLSAKAEVKGMEGNIDSDYIGKGGKAKVKQGMGVGLGFISFEGEREFKGSLDGSGETDDDKINLKAGVFSEQFGGYIQRSIPIGDDGKNNKKERKSINSYFGEIGGKAKLLFGIEIKMKFGIQQINKSNE